MPIEVGDAPQAAFDAISRKLADPRNSFLLRGAFGPEASPRGVFLAVPHRIAHLPVKAIQYDTNLIDVVEMRHWRFLVIEEKRFVSAADTSAETASSAIADATSVEVAPGKYEFGTWGEQGLAAATKTAIRKAEADERVRDPKSNYEPFLLLVPGIKFAALWLKDRAEKESSGESVDLIVPMPPTSILEPFEVMSSKDFFQRVASIAKGLPLIAHGA